MRQDPWERPNEVLCDFAEFQVCLNFTIGRDGALWKIEPYRTDFFFRGLILRIRQGPETRGCVSGTMGTLPGRRGMARHRRWSLKVWRVPSPGRTGRPDAGPVVHALPKIPAALLAQSFQDRGNGGNRGDFKTGCDPGGSHPKMGRGNLGTGSGQPDLSSTLRIQVLIFNKMDTKL